MNGRDREPPRGPREPAARDRSDGALDRVVPITVTGPESTGKTTLAAALARHLSTAWTSEFARAYAAGGAASPPRLLTAADVEPIARGQAAQQARAQRAARARGLRALVQDTDLVSTVVYARHYYGSCPAWIVNAAGRARAALYLLCDVDVPWIPDGVRDRPDAREAIMALFRATLAELGCDVALVSGSWDERTARAVRAVNALLRSDDERRATR